MLREDDARRHQICRIVNSGIDFWVKKTLNDFVIDHPLLALVAVYALLLLAKFVVGTDYDPHSDPIADAGWLCVDGSQ